MCLILSVNTVEIYFWPYGKASKIHEHCFQMQILVDFRAAIQSPLSP